MRRRRPFAVITFASTEQALAAEALLHERSLPGRLIPIPTQITAGCGLAWKAEPEQQAALLEALTQSGVGFEKYAMVELYG